VRALMSGFLSTVSVIGRVLSEGVQT
jgi:hypothetical protein